MLRLGFRHKGTATACNASRRESESYSPSHCPCPRNKWKRKLRGRVSRFHRLLTPLTATKKRRNLRRILLLLMTWTVFFTDIENAIRTGTRFVMLKQAATRWPRHKVTYSSIFVSFISSHCSCIQHCFSILSRALRATPQSKPGTRPCSLIHLT